LISRDVSGWHEACNDHTKMRRDELDPAVRRLAIEGNAMDRPIVRPRWHRWRWPLGGAAAAAALIGLVALTPAPEHVQRVAADSVTIGEVVRGQFDDEVAVRAIVTPLRTVVLDAVAGGRVQRVLVDDGQLVAAGQPLAELANVTLQLDVLAREAQVAEQLNLLRSQELSLERRRVPALPPVKA
jgi:HlyD family secretion protein